MKTPKQLAKQIEHLTTLRVTEVYETDDPTIEDDSITLDDPLCSGKTLYLNTWHIQICAMDNGRLCLNQWLDDETMKHSKMYSNIPSLVKSELPQFLR